MQFNKLKFSDIDLINNVLKDTDFCGCEYQYSYQRAWFSRDEELDFAIVDGIIYIAFCTSHLARICERTLFLPPLTTPDRLPEAYSRLEKYCNDSKMDFCVVRAPREHIDMLGNRYNYMLFTSMTEYLYAPYDLINLEGKRYHAKRNHIAKFIRTYDYIFREYSHEDFDEIMSLYDSWSQLKDVNEDDVEKFALWDMLQNWDKHNLKVGVLIINNKIIAFACGEITANNVGIVHFEKADINYDGAYAFINNMFSKYFFSEVRCINRQEDMWIDGLRKAKLSYYPIAMCDKWIIIKK